MGRSSFTSRPSAKIIPHSPRSQYTQIPPAYRPTFQQSDSPKAEIRTHQNCCDPDSPTSSQEFLTTTPSPTPSPATENKSGQETGHPSTDQTRRIKHGASRPNSSRQSLRKELALKSRTLLLDHIQNTFSNAPVARTINHVFLSRSTAELEGYRWQCTGGYKMPGREGRKGAVRSLTSFSTEQHEELAAALEDGRLRCVLLDDERRDDDGMADRNQRSNGWSDCDEEEDISLVHTDADDDAAPPWEKAELSRFSESKTMLFNLITRTLPGVINSIDDVHIARHTTEQLGYVWEFKHGYMFPFDMSQKGGKFRSLNTFTIQDHIELREALEYGSLVVAPKQEHAFRGLRSVTSLSVVLQDGDSGLKVSDMADMGSNGDGLREEVRKSEELENVEVDTLDVEPIEVPACGENADGCFPDGQAKMSSRFSVVSSPGTDEVLQTLGIESGEHCLKDVEDDEQVDVNEDRPIPTECHELEFTNFRVKRFPGLKADHSLSQGRKRKHAELEPSNAPLSVHASNLAGNEDTQLSAPREPTPPTHSPITTHNISSSPSPTQTSPTSNSPDQPAIHYNPKYQTGLRARGIASKHLLLSHLTSNFPHLSLTLDNIFLHPWHTYRWEFSGGYTLPMRPSRERHAKSLFAFTVSEHAELAAALRDGRLKAVLLAEAEERPRNTDFKKKDVGLAAQVEETSSGGTEVSESQVAGDWTSIEQRRIQELEVELLQARREIENFERREAVMLSVIEGRKGADSRGLRLDSLAQYRFTFAEEARLKPLVLTAVVGVDRVDLGFCCGGKKGRCLVELERDD
ncbi:hypothetical protein BJ508DRAFT_324069 [Ascobolus immersus RN42]|uniref:Uncharacterized protein n=1 Tax=Ascobolus immersus RN42 TaxID=1160509 RepID=A0A3N4ID79_ASCIM|nr:hypothetical protein BJ508DRAFT_324069 [Ascobolus immersus RN42]